jgi:hypothetical protein
MTADARLTPEELERTLWGLMQATSPIDGLMVHKVRAHIAALEQENAALRARVAGPTRCECGVPLRRSHFCPELNHAWVSASLAPEDR